MSMLWSPSYLIVVGPTAKSFSECLKDPSFIIAAMDSAEEKDKDISKPEMEKEPGIEIVRARTSNILPSVHSAVAAASPIFSSYRSMFQSWKHSVPKLYKYPSSDIEVVVYRKNGDVEKLSKCKNDVNMNKKTYETGSDEASDSSDTVNSSLSKLDTKADDVLSEFNEKTTTDMDSGANAGRRDDKQCNEEHVVNFKDFNCEKTPELNYVPSDDRMSEDSFPQSKPILYTYAEKSICSTEEGLNDRITEKESKTGCGVHHSRNSSNEPNCEFIFNIKTFSNVPLLNRRLRKSFNNKYAQTKEDASFTSSTTKATQIVPRDFVVCQNVECQYDADLINILTNGTQTEAQHIKTSDFSQTFPVSSDAAIQIKIEKNVVCQNAECQYDSSIVNRSMNGTQTEELRIDATDFTQTFPILSDAAIQIEKNVVCQNAGCQYDIVNISTNGTQTEEHQLSIETSDFTQAFPILSDVATQIDKNDVTMLASSVQTSESNSQQLLHYTVDWHSNVPCCNVSNQTDPNILNLVKDYSCQVVPDVVSKSSQIDSDLLANMTKNVSTNTDSNEKCDVGVQLSASCCYFTKKREKRKYEARLDAVRNEIRSFYLNLQKSTDGQALLKQDNVLGEKNTLEEGGDQQNRKSDSEEHGCKSLEKTLDEKENSLKALEEAKKHLDDLGHEVDELVGHASLLNSNSFGDTSYFEDDWLQSSI